MPATTKFYTVPAGTPSAQCKGPTCRAVIYFIENPTSGKRMPVDCDVEGGEAPSPKADPRQMDAFDARRSEGLGSYDGRGVSHFTTCPDADRFTRGAGR
jgi:hypothetical protein